MFEILKGHVVGDLVLPSRRAPDARIGAQVDSVIARCLEKEPARRYASAEELVDALSECVGERAFLRDAHRLPGIHESGIDLSDGTTSARRASDRQSPAESGFSEVEKVSEWDRLAEVDERPDRRRKRALDRRDTARISRHRSSPVALVAALVVIGGAGALWAFREQLGLVKGDEPIAKAAPLPKQETMPAPATSPPPTQASTGTVAAPALAAPGRAGTLANIGAAQPTAAPAPGKLADAEKPEQVRTRPSAAAARRPSPALPPSIPIPSVPVPPEPVVAAPTPAAPTPPPTPAVDVNTLLKDAQQAWSRRYYGVAIDKAREVLKASPGRHEAYQIIAVCSCAVGAAEDAREAVSHLDAYKQKLVQSLCKNHGVTLE
jgi:hypothetical protein